MSNQPPPLDYATPGTSQRPRSRRGLIFGMIFAFLAVMFFMLMRAPDTARGTGVSFGKFQQDLATGNVRSIVIFGDELEYTAYRPIVTNSPVQAASGQITARVRLARDMGHDWRFTQWVMETANSQRNATNPDIHFSSQSDLIANLLLPLIPWLLIFTFIYLFFFRGLWRQQAAVLANPRPTHVVIDNPEALRS
jgi:ATP-dependent Zn protease